MDTIAICFSFVLNFFSFCQYMYVLLHLISICNVFLHAEKSDGTIVAEEPPSPSVPEELLQEVWQMKESGLCT